MRKNNLHTVLSVLLVLFISACNSGGNKSASHKTGIYLQEVKNDISLPDGNEQNIIKLLKAENKIYAISPDAVYEYSGNEWKKHTLKGEWYTAATGSDNKLWLGGKGVLLNFETGEKIELPKKYINDSILCMFGEYGEKPHIGTNNGLFAFNRSWEIIPGTEGVRVNQITKGKGTDMWVATSDGIFRRRDNKWLNLNNYVMAPGLGRNFNSITSGKNSGDIIFGNGIALSQISEDGNHWMYTAADGLPYGPLTTINYADNEIWLGTPEGAIKKDKKWNYYYGKRWLPANKVNDILRIDPKTVWIATPKGISEIKNIDYTLAKKSDLFEKRLNERHIHHGFVSDCIFKVPGDTTSFYSPSFDNDGLWTSIYLAAESFRYAVTGEQEAYDNAVRTYEAMEMLETINPIPGFVSRSYVKLDEDQGKDGEWHVSADGKWKWKGDTSSDEIAGHMFAYPIFYELVAKGEMKERVKGLVDRIMTHIVDNKYRLVDLDGIPTRWGDWSPESINNDPGWMYERGLSSMQMLSFLESAYFVTGNDKFRKAYRSLIDEHHYADNMVEQKMYWPYEINHSDDELAFLPYYCLLRYTRDPELKKIYRKSMARSWSVEQPDRNPLWNIIASASLGKDCDIEVAINELKDYPMDIRSWAVKNSHRWDIQRNPAGDRFMREQAKNVIPVKERGITKWNSNPYKLDYSGSGRGEDCGSAWLLPYWMGRYHKFIIETGK